MFCLFLIDLKQGNMFPRKEALRVMIAIRNHFSKNTTTKIGTEIEITQTKSECL